MDDLTRPDTTKVATALAPADTAWATECGSDCSVTIPNPRHDRFWVYVGWGADRSRPLYIGKARKPWVRFLFHMRETTWAAGVEEWELHGFPAEFQAETAEIEAIHDLDPIHNSMRRLTVAEWEVIHREADARRAAKQTARARAAERLASGRVKPPSVPVVSPHPRKRLRRIAWRDDLFTPDQLAIIKRVQDRKFREGSPK